MVMPLHAWQFRTVAGMEAPDIVLLTHRSSTVKLDRLERGTHEFLVPIVPIQFELRLTCCVAFCPVPKTCVLLFSVRPTVQVSGAARNRRCLLRIVGVVKTVPEHTTQMSAGLDPAAESAELICAPTSVPRFAHTW